MTLDEVLDELIRIGAKMWAEGESLKMRVPRGSVSPTLAAAIQSHKPDLLQLVAMSASWNGATVPYFHPDPATLDYHALREKHGLRVVDSWLDGDEVRVVVTSSKNGRCSK